MGVPDEHTNACELIDPAAIDAGSGLGNEELSSFDCRTIHG